MGAVTTNPIKQKLLITLLFKKMLQKPPSSVTRCRSLLRFLCPENPLPSLAFLPCLLLLLSSANTSTALCLVAQLRPTLLNPTDHSPPGFSVPGASPGKNTGVGRHALLQGIFPTQGSNPGLPPCRWILYRLSHQGSPLYN